MAVFVLVQAMAVGLEKASANTGDPRNVMIVRKGSTAESSSQVTLEQFQTDSLLAGNRARRERQAARLRRRRHAHSACRGRMARARRMSSLRGISPMGM